MEPCTRAGPEKTTCCFFFDGRCGGHASYPEGYGYVKPPFTCVFDIKKKTARVKKVKTLF